MSYLYECNLLIIFILLLYCIGHDGVQTLVRLNRSQIHLLFVSLFLYVFVLMN